MNPLTQALRLTSFISRSFPEPCSSDAPVLLSFLDEGAFESLATVSHLLEKERDYGSAGVPLSTRLMMGDPMGGAINQGLGMLNDLEEAFFRIGEEGEEAGQMEPSAQRKRFLLLWAHSAQTLFDLSPPQFVGDFPSSDAEVGRLLDDEEKRLQGSSGERIPPLFLLDSLLLEGYQDRKRPEVNEDGMYYVSLARLYSRLIQPIVKAYAESFDYALSEFGGIKSLEEAILTRGSPPLQQVQEEEQGSEERRLVKKRKRNMMSAGGFDVPLVFSADTSGEEDDCDSSCLVASSSSSPPSSFTLRREERINEQICVLRLVQITRRCPHSLLSEQEGEAWLDPWNLKQRLPFLWRIIQNQRKMTLKKFKQTARF